MDGTQESVFQAQESVKTAVPDCVMAGGWTRKGTNTTEHLSAPSPGILVPRAEDRPLLSRSHRVLSAELRTAHRPAGPNG